MRALVASDRVGIPRADLLWMASETFSFLDRLLGEVREGKNVLLASQFARWLEFSGLLKVFEGLEGCRGYYVCRCLPQTNFGTFGCGSRFQINLEGPRTMDPIAREPKNNFGGESRVTPQKFFGHGCMRGRENL